MPEETNISTIIAWSLLKRKYWYCSKILFKVKFDLIKSYLAWVLFQTLLHPLKMVISLKSTVLQQDPIYLLHENLKTVGKNRKNLIVQLKNL